MITNILYVLKNLKDYKYKTYIYNQFIKLFLNVITIICIILFLSMAYFKLKYPFWSRQPVFHYHKLNYWIFPPGIIQEELTRKK